MQTFGFDLHYYLSFRSYVYFKLKSFSLMSYIFGGLSCRRYRS
ncbi:hypothetical protein CUS_7998 [Ruminococcus albus 8]|uniref:Uncharacterized protein n=1 Tax=Ruminococcus albus 8 TaxID=246199 RepID=E9SAN7_RUMAL|nr:hypothetical protein CUS_7998 [Ruminococcus albus 8]